MEKNEALENVNQQLRIWEERERKAKADFEQLSILVDSKGSEIDKMKKECGRLMQERDKYQMMALKLSEDFFRLQKEDAVRKELELKLKQQQEDEEKFVQELAHLRKQHSEHSGADGEQKILQDKIDGLKQEIGKLKEEIERRKQSEIELNIAFEKVKSDLEKANYDLEKTKTR